MPNALRTASLWAPPLVLMALIFAFSAMPSDVEDRGTLQFLLRKVVHFSEYALLLALWWRALQTKLRMGRALALAFLLTLSYAISDEIHQTYVDGRIGTPRDVAIDALGMCAAGALILRSGRVRDKEVARA